MKKTFFLSSLAFASLLILTVFSCSSKPNEERAEEDLRKLIHNESNGNLELLAFEKTNASEREEFGQEAYVIEYTATLQVKKNCYMYVNSTGYGSFFKDFKTYSKAPTYIPMKEIVECDKGMEVEFSDIIKYIEPKKGWIRVKKSTFD